MAETKSRITNREVSDEVLVQRVRAKMGRYVSHPSSIEVSAHQGYVTLRGPILAHEVGNFLNALAKVRGVTGLNNQLEVHKVPGDVPGLQGGIARPGERFELRQENWAPAARFAVGTAGSALTLYGAKRPGVLGTMASLLGLGLVARSVTNLKLKRLLGVDAGRRAVDIQKTINVNAPVREVFAFWSNFENFPRFMAHVREVRNLGDGRSHWTVDGPAGVPVSWDAVITRYMANELLAWRSEPGSVIGNAGIVHFTPNAQGGTQINITLSYNPPAGALGHTVAAFFGSDPKTAMDEDLVRFKSLIEQGKTTAEGETVTRDELEPQQR
jgi:uncharacterized membrane protein